MNAKLVTSSAVLRVRRNSGVSVMTREACRMTVRHSHECSLLQPERIAQIRWRLYKVLVIRISLRLIQLMTDRTTLWLVLGISSEFDTRKPTGSITAWSIEAYNVKMLIVRESYAKLRRGIATFQIWIS